MRYPEWEASVPAQIKAEAIWNSCGYRRALFLHELGWRDCEKLLQHPLGREVLDHRLNLAGEVIALLITELKASARH